MVRDEIVGLGVVKLYQSFVRLWVYGKDSFIWEDRIAAKGGRLSLV